MKPEPEQNASAVAGQAAREWTPDTVKEIITGSADHIQEWCKLCDAHNAAIDAERERYDDLQRSVMDLSHPNCKELLSALRLQKQDTERLDWLDNEQALCDAGGKEYYQSWEVTAPEIFRGGIREAIDAAMSQARQEGEG